MASSGAEEIVHDFPSIIRVYRDGRVERLRGTDIVPPSTNHHTGVQSKDVVIDLETGLSARLYLPNNNPHHNKLPFLVYFHAGGFCIETAFSSTYHNYLNSLVAKAKVVVVSVDYRRAPEHPLPIAYDDSWAAVKWVASHSSGGGGEVWLKDYVDFDRMFFAGHSAGANIAHNMGIRVGSDGPDGVKLVGMVLIHPYFGGKDPIGGEKTNMGRKAVCDKLWGFVNPSAEDGCDDPLFNPAKDPKLSSLGCNKLLVCVGEKDLLKERGCYYKEELEKSGWGGMVEIVESAGEDHVFHLFNPTCDSALAMLDRVASFLNQDK
ncbi:unnamed protein product [Camellia sinensis]